MTKTYPTIEISRTGQTSAEVAEARRRYCWGLTALVLSSLLFGLGISLAIALTNPGMELFGAGVGMGIGGGLAGLVGGQYARITRPERFRTSPQD